MGSNGSTQSPQFVNLKYTYALGLHFFVKNTTTFPNSHIVYIFNCKCVIIILDNLLFSANLFTKSVINTLQLQACNNGSHCLVGSHCMLA